MKRQLNHTLAAYIEQRLARLGLSAPSTPREWFVAAALALEGVREEGGNNRGRVVALIQDTVGSPESEPWCMSLVQSCLAFAELKTGAVSPVVASEHCLTVWEQSPHAQRVKYIPLPGAIAIWQHGTSRAGHTGVTLSTPIDRGTFEVVEGNTEAGLNANAAVVREGGGAYRTRRSMDGAGTMRLLGFLKPF